MDSSFIDSGESNNGLSGLLSDLVALLLGPLLLLPFEPALLLLLLEAVLLAGVGIEYGEKRCDPTGLMIIVFEEDELRTGYIGRGRRRVDPLDDEDSFAGGGL